MLGVLLKKQMTEKLSYFKRDKKRIDIVGALLTLVMSRCSARLSRNIWKSGSTAYATCARDNMK